MTHKPWLALKSSAPGGAAASFAPLIQAFQQDNPVTQAQGLSAATGVHQVGTATIAGTATTEYTGYFNWAAAAAHVDPSLRKELGSALTSGAAIHFSVWLDGQHYVRKIVDSTTGPAGHSTVQVLITSINQPVHVAVPPASQVGTIPGA